jgi:hypothetical protein
MPTKCATRGDWKHGGPLIERERISLIASEVQGEILWSASVGEFGHFIDSSLPLDEKYSDHNGLSGKMPLIAAMRAYVASKFGEEVDL